MGGNPFNWKRPGASSLTALTLLLVAGCGGGDDSTPKEEFVERADAICAEANDRGTELAMEVVEDPAAPTPAEAQEFVRRAVTLQRDLLADLRELEPPEGDEETIERWLAAIERGTRIIERTSRNERASLRLFRTSANPFRQAEAISAQYGLVDCAS